MSEDRLPSYDIGALSTPSLTFDAPSPPYLARVPEIAKRLGVEPITDEHPPTFMLNVGSDRYDLFDLINAFLDKIEERA